MNPREESKLKKTEKSEKIDTSKEKELAKNLNKNYGPETLGNCNI
jgi:hypothetical protein